MSSVSASSAIDAMISSVTLVTSAAGWNLNQTEVDSTESSDDDDVCGALTGPDFSKDGGSYDILMILWYITIVFSVCASVLSLYLCLKHCQHYFKPAQQRWIVRIIFMVPIYALCSTLSFRLFWLSTYIDIIRDCYEAFVIFGFFVLLQQYLGDTFAEQHRFMQTLDRQRMTYPFPLNCFTFNPRGQAFLINTKTAILQYVAVRPAMTVLSYVLASAGALCPKSMSPMYGQFWITSINFVSVSVAMYALILFYLVIHHEIEEYKPFWKFVAVKFVVFFSFWQAIVLDMLDRFGAIKGTTALSADNTADLIQSFLVCIEMLVAALLHMKAFPHQDYQLLAGPAPPAAADPFSAKTAGEPAAEAASAPAAATVRTRLWPALRDVISPMDILRDFTEAPKTIREHRRRTKDKKRKRHLAQFENAFDESIERSSVVDFTHSGMSTRAHSLRTSRDFEGVATRDEAEEEDGLEEGGGKQFSLE
ncbi:organic solute transporter Ostalpha-domain-containing protein [Zopfochytrium polystomum]|nr:organic solute transporter Ostalpha-domain-containing protein [Zopfochytrium polystomum]